ncbi:MAG: hypothetical protein JOZ51_17020 [Chloroflexi bacterium]|nr:hypothetical protein [Chloroflexota bacterium]
MLNGPQIHPLSIVELLIASARLYRDNILSFVLITALVLVPYNLLTFLLANPAAPIPNDGSTLGMITGFLRSTSRPNSSGWPSWIYGLAIDPLLSGTLILIAVQCYQQQTVTIGANFRRARQRWLTLIFANILQGLIFILAALPLIVVAICGVSAITDLRVNAILAGGSPSSGTIDTIPAILFILVGALFLALPLIVQVRMAFTTQAVLLEEQGAAASIDRSWKLTQRMWPIIGFGVAIWLLELCLTRLPVGAVVYGMARAGADAQLVMALQVALATIAQIVILPFTIIAYTLMFFDLLVRDEGFDLHQTLLTPPPDDGEYQPALST